MQTIIQFGRISKAADALPYVACGIPGQILCFSCMKAALERPQGAWLELGWSSVKTAWALGSMMCCAGDVRAVQELCEN